MRARSIAGILLGLLGVFSGPLGASPVPRGEVFRLDAPPDCSEREPDLAPLPNGGFVAVWTSAPTTSAEYRVHARVFDAAGTPAGPVFQVDAPPGQASASQAAVAAAADGRFLVVWHDDIRDQVIARLFSAAGAPLTAETAVAPLISEPELDVTAVPGGGFAVHLSNTGEGLLRLLDEDGGLDSQLISVASYGSITGTDPRVRDPRIAAQPDGDLVVVWTVRDEGIFEASFLVGTIIPAATAEDRGTWRDLELGEQLDGWIVEPAVGVDAVGNIVLAWRADLSPGERPLGLTVQLLDPTGRRVNPSAMRVGGTGWWRLGSPALLVNPDGSFVLAWPGSRQAGFLNALYAQTFSFEGVPQGDRVEVVPIGSGWGRENPALVRAADGEAILAWQEGFAVVPGSPCAGEGLSAQRLHPGCVPGAGRLCLGDGRFQLETTWSAPGTGSGSGPGVPVPVTRDTGYFWFFDPANVELMVKVLDGRTINGKFWVFYGSLSNVAWRLRVTDLQTGAVKSYDNPRNQLASRGDTDALPGADTAAGSFELRPFRVVGVDAAPSHTPGEAGAGPCTSSELPVVRRPGLCLNDERFEVEVTWHDPFNGGQGVGEGVPLTDDSGYFWFFNPANVELVVKALDARTVNGKFWFFYGALTNVEYDIRVRHFSGDEKTYHNPPFQFLSRADTAAFTPTNCPCLPVNQPVCGKDGVTYPSECAARCVGYVEVAKPGAC